MKSNRLTQVVFLSFLSLLLLNNCGEQKSSHQNPLPTVTVVSLKEQPVTLTTELPGRTRPYRVSEVRPQVTGIILKREFVEGSDVKRGQSLYLIDPAAYQANYDSAQGDLAKAQASAEINHLTVKRYKPLLGTSYVSRQEYDTAIANAKQADAGVVAAAAALENARINLHYTKVYSPISGRIGKSAVTEGALVTAGQETALASVQQLDPIYVDLTQSSADFLRLKREVIKGSLKKGEDSVVVDLFLEDQSLYPWKGTLQFSDVTVDEGTGSITLRAIFPNPHNELLPGMFVRARITEGIKDNALLAPQRGITRNARGEAVALLVDKDNKVIEKNLVTGPAIGDQWLVQSGLKAGDKLIVEGQLKIKPGMVVQPEETQDLSPGFVKQPAKTFSSDKSH